MEAKDNKGCDIDYGLSNLSRNEDDYRKQKIGCSCKLSALEDGDVYKNEPREKSTMF